MQWFLWTHSASGTVERLKNAAWKKCYPQTPAMIATIKKCDLGILKYRAKNSLANSALTSLKMVRFWQSRGLWKALEEPYRLIATINKCDFIKGRKDRIYFLLAFKTRFTVFFLVKSKKTGTVPDAPSQ